MKKKIAIITIAILWISTFSLYADIKIGVKGGVNLAKPAFSTAAIKSENFTGFQVGPIVEISGLTGFGIDAAILYSQQGIKIKNPKNLLSSSYSGDLTIPDYEEKVSTIDIPANLKLKLSLADRLGVYLSAGPYVSFRVDGQTSFNQIKEDWTSKQFGVGLNFGVGAILLKHLQIGVNHQVALNHDYKDFPKESLTDVKAQTRIWSITAAVFF